MSKKILISLTVIGVVAAIAIGGTIAYFSDTETSAGNLFVAGAIDLKIDNECWKGGEYTYGSDCTWTETDLDGELFFNFSDLKPGDWGEDTVSLHVYDNDAWACVTFDNMVDYDNACTEPEAEDGDQSCSDPGPGEGELSQYLSFIFWADMCGINDAIPGDNIYQPQCDYELMAGWADEILPGTTYTLAAPGEYNVFTGVPGEPLFGNHDYYIGKAWCFGEMIEVLPDGTVACDGEPVNNIPQTDSLEADIIFYAEQSRNNPNFICQAPRPIIGADLDSYVQTTNCDITVGSKQAHITIQAGIDAATAGQTVCVEAGTYDEDVNVNKDITLAGSGASGSSIINGQASGYAGAVVISSSDVTVQGFIINGASNHAVYFSNAVDGVTIDSNKIVAASGQNALETVGGQTNHVINNNEFVGNGARQLTYVNGNASVSVASDNVDFTNNTFNGTLGTGNIALGNEAANSEITGNVFEVTLTSTYAIADLWEDTIVVNTNNFNGVGGTKVKNGDAGTLNAENNWWGDNDPSDNVSVNVDYDPWESSAYPEN